MSWVLKLRVDKKVDREAFFEKLWREYGQLGLEGVHEGTVLADHAAEVGLETESWTLDAAEAPRERDWVGQLGSCEVELYWAEEAQARRAKTQLQKQKEVEIVSLTPVENKDWDAEWKASFRGVDIRGVWKVVPPWELANNQMPEDRTLVLNPGAGFGTGTHETTQLCLLALARVRPDLRDLRVLDFGSGSGILAIGAAKLGAAHVDAVEIDPLAIDNAVENARLNSIGGQIEFSRYLKDEGRVYDGVLANILRPVLIEFSKTLVGKIKPGGFLILSGLIESDVAPVVECYAPLMGSEPTVMSDGDWRALVWKNSKN